MTLREREYREALIGFFGRPQPGLRFMVTIPAQHGQGNTEEVEKRLRKFIWRLRDRIYGHRRFRHKELRHISLLENKTKYRNKCLLHSHSIFCIESEFSEKFDFYCKSVARSMKFIDVDVRPVYDPEGAIRYVSKNIDPDFILL